VCLAVSIADRRKVAAFKRTWRVGVRWLVNATRSGRWGRSLRHAVHVHVCVCVRETRRNSRANAHKRQARHRTGPPTKSTCVGSSSPSSRKLRPVATRNCPNIALPGHIVVVFVVVAPTAALVTAGRPIQREIGPILKPASQHGGPIDAEPENHEDPEGLHQKGPQAHY
jgi:hypothetical protein